MKKLILILVVMAVFGAGAYFLPYGNLSLSTPKRETVFSAYSLDGQLVSLTSKRIVVTVGRVEETSIGNQFVTSDKGFALAPSINLIDGATSKNIAAAALGTYIKAKDRAVFTGSATTSPWSGGLLTVSKVEILNRATPIPPPRSAPVVR